jgi:hypothetical protein
VRSIAGITGRVLLGVVVALLLAAAILVILAFYADMSFDVEGVLVAVALAGVIVFLWTRWR